jgi:hypothetical protein
MPRRRVEDPARAARQDLHQHEPAQVRSKCVWERGQCLERLHLARRASPARHRPGSTAHASAGKLRACDDRGRRISDAAPSVKQKPARLERGDADPGALAALVQCCHLTWRKVRPLRRASAPTARPSCVPEPEPMLRDGLLNLDANAARQMKNCAIARSARRATPGRDARYRERPSHSA